MMDILVILLALSVLSICVFMKCITDLSKRIDELEKKIDNIQYQTEGILCDINIVNQMIYTNYSNINSLLSISKYLQFTSIISSNSSSDNISLRLSKTIDG